jgi:hypothetical protein
MWYTGACSVSRRFRDLLRWRDVQEPATARDEHPNDLTRYGDYAGVYELTPGTQRAVSIEGKDLYAQRTARVKKVLIPEAPDLFFAREWKGGCCFDA